jgi:hypothetical protein
MLSTISLIGTYKKLGHPFVNVGFVTLIDRLQYPLL